MGSSAIPTLSDHLDNIIETIKEGTLVMFLGAGANMCGRKTRYWKPGESTDLPSGGELAGHLAKEFDYPFRKFASVCDCHQETHVLSEAADDLLRVSQYAELKKDAGLLYRRLCAVFDRAYPPTTLHGLIAALPKYSQLNGHQSSHLLVVTTNYDDLMESAFQAAGETVDVVYYMADGPQKGRFIHQDITGVKTAINDPVSYTGLTLKDRSIVFKIHGSVHREAPEGEERRDSFVITEDHYIDYLTRTDLSNIPKLLLAKMKSSNFLFLGYSLRDWNLRAFLHRIWQERTIFFRSWAIQRSPDPLDVEFWTRRRIQVLDADLEEYVDELATRLGISLAKTAGAGK